MNSTPITTIGTERIAPLEGVRALAVLLVLGFHGGLHFLRGGHLGVDLFFVLSGFVITRSLLREARTPQRVSLIRFWAHRSARLLPAAVVSIVGGGLLFAFLSSPNERTDVATDAQSALLYVANWRFINQATSYFRPTVEASPFLHMWSLSVEEQFYVLWPIVMVLLCWLWRRSRRTQHTATPPAWLFAVLAVGATSWTIRVVVHGSEAHAYYGTDTRAYQLLWGAALAALLSGGRTISARSASWVASISSVAIVGLAVQPIGSGATRGLLVTLPAVLLIGALSSAPTGPVAGLYARRSMVWLGGLSYAIYLWHWHFVVAIDRLVVASAPVRTLVVALASIGLARLSAVALETPIRGWVHRHSARRPAALGTVAAGLAVVAIGAVAVTPLVTSDRITMLRAADRPGFTAGGRLSAGQTPIPDDLGGTRVGPGVKGDACENDVVDATRTCLVVDGDGPTVLVIGDSHAGDLLPGWRSVAMTNGLRLHLITTAGCPWQQGLATTFDSETCRAAQEATYGDWLQTLSPDIVVLVGHPLLEPSFAVSARGSDTPLDAAELTAASIDSLDRLDVPGRTLVVLGPRPTAPFDVWSCLGVARFQEDCLFVASHEADTQESALVSALADRPGIIHISVAPLVCPRLPVCDPIVDGVAVRIDTDHLHPRFATQLVIELWGLIETAATDG
ncbi:MAG TPA: hypothetical protein DCR14_11635 [Acidimicrobiaceae bacterium]|nr:hypothetical protein [Acidimicrobiaceae bacterium]